MREKDKATGAAPLQIQKLTKGKDSECLRDKQIVFRYLYDEPRTRGGQGASQGDMPGQAFAQRGVYHHEPGLVSKGTTTFFV